MSSKTHRYFLFCCLLTLLLGIACQPTTGAQPLLAENSLPTIAIAAQLPTETPTVPPTWTPQPAGATQTQTDGLHGIFQTGEGIAISTRQATETPLPIPTNTPITPTATQTATPTETPDYPTPIFISQKPFWTYSLDQPIPLKAYPRPPNDNGWGMHWVPTVSQDPAVVDRFVPELNRMHMKWVVFLNDHANVGDNDYLVGALVNNGMMPVMRLYRDSVLPYNGDVGRLVRHYRRQGVFYYQLYNEPNVNIENNQGSANPNNYAKNWTIAAREVVNNGGLPGIAALSPGGEYDHLEFYRRTLRAIKFSGDEDLLNRAWVSLHNYHGTRPKDDLGGFLMFREYDRITREELGRSLPIIGTEGGSYSDNPAVVIDLLSYQYRYMQNAEPYYFATTYWLLANQEGGGWDDQWEWQTIFRPGYTHPVVTEFFYKNSR